MAYAATVTFEKLRPDAQLPKYAHPGDAGADICTPVAVVLQPGETLAWGTGLRADIPEGFELQVRSRSGLAAKQALHILNAPGTIDRGYRGEIKIIMHNASNVPQSLASGERVAQLVLTPIYVMYIQEGVVEVNTARGAGGLGSTGRC